MPSGPSSTARAGYVGVMTPIVALIVSSLFEGFQWTAATVAGITLAVTGNAIALGPHALGFASKSRVGALRSSNDRPST